MPSLLPSMATSVLQAWNYTGAAYRAIDKFQTEQDSKQAFKQYKKHPQSIVKAFHEAWIHAAAAELAARRCEFAADAEDNAAVPGHLEAARVAYEATLATLSLPPE